MRQIVRMHAGKLSGALLAVALGTAALAATPPGTTSTGNLAVNVQPNGAHTLGNPAAKVKVTEYASYTCSHCAHFHKESELPLRMLYIGKGQVSFTMQHMVRDPIDLTIAMLTNCGDPKQFFRMHNAFMSTQNAWLPKAQGFSQSQTDRWQSGPIPDRLRAIASDFDFYARVAPFGITRPAADKCLADEAMLQKIMDQRMQAFDLGITGTPGFAINGELVRQAHDWATLEPQIKSHL